VPFQPYRESGTKISAKLLLSFAAIFLMLLGLGAYSLIAIERLGMSLDTAASGNARKLQLLGQVQAGVQAMRANSTEAQLSLIDMMMERLSGSKRNKIHLACSSCHSKENVQQEKQRFVATATEVRGHIAELRPLVRSTQDQSLLDDIEAKTNQWLQFYDRYLNRAGERDFDGAHEIVLNRIDPLIENLNRSAAPLEARQRELLATAGREAGERVAASRRVTWLLLVLSILAGAVVCGIIRGVNASLRGFAKELERVTGKVAAVAKQVSSSSQSLAQGASEQVASLQETSSSSDEIHSMARQSAESSVLAAAKMEESSRKVEEANESLRQMILSMEAIGASSKKVSGIIKVIDEIAFQTNILALNAAVEAARAGVAGLGFSVVADEVRSLAQRCAEAAHDTTDLIEESIAMSEEGIGRFDHVMERVRAITESAAEAKKLIDAIQSSSREQNRGVEHIAQAIGRVERVTEATVASARQNAAAGEHLSAQSGALKEIVERLAALV
jgi:methyl-accepting chemotaxis protein